MERRERGRKWCAGANRWSLEVEGLHCILVPTEGPVDRGSNVIGMQPVTPALYSPLYQLDIKILDGLRQDNGIIQIENERGQFNHNHVCLSTSLSPILPSYLLYCVLCMHTATYRKR